MRVHMYMWIEYYFAVKYVMIYVHDCLVLVCVALSNLVWNV